MSYHIEAIELFVRETPPGRMLFTLGKADASVDADEERMNPLGHVRLVLKDSSGATTFGCAADRLSVRWLDKRPARSRSQKRRELVELIHTARDIYLKHADFESPFQLWRMCHSQIMEAGGVAGQEDLTASFASALMERAAVDAVCRLHNTPVFDMVKQDRLGFRPAEIHREVADLEFTATLPSRPQTSFFIRHTIGLADPLTDDELPKDQRVNDGLPETLVEAIQRDGIHYFKVKISGDPNRDLERLSRIWDVVVGVGQPEITLDANESYSDLKTFAEFVKRLESEKLGLFQHILYIEQPLPRNLTLDRSTSQLIREIAERKPLLIDEADGTVDAYKRAKAIGYRGTSHKNCKGFFKSLLNYALVVNYALDGDATFLSGEDLQNLPVVPLHQDFATLGILGLEQCERYGHHYNFGLSMLSPKDKANVVKHHPDMYVKRGDEWFLNIRDGAVDCASLQCPGFGVRDEPDWASMEPMRKWILRRHSA